MDLNIKLDKSGELFNESKKYLVGGVNSPVRSFKPFPFFVKSAKSCFLYDEDGNEFIDYCLAYGPMVLGHANEKILNAVKEQMDFGTAYGVPSEKEIILAKEVINRIPCAEMVRFVNSGTEATMGAIRLARGVTKRNKIIKFEGAFHGAHDYVLVKSGSGALTHGAPNSPGIPEDTTKNTLLIPFNDEGAVRKVISENKGEIACIILEPMMGNVGCILPKDGYLKFLREITEENGIILIFDEVITGFRLSKGGAQEYYGVKADIATLGKILGGGFPIGAIAGKKELMEQFSPKGQVYQAGTFNGNPISVTAGIETLKNLNNAFYKETAKKAEILSNYLIETTEKYKIPARVYSVASIFQVYFNDKDILTYDDAKSSDTEKFMKYFYSLLENGVFIPPSQFECCFTSIKHDDFVLEKTMNAIDIAMKKL
ncbi:glutamate-1-semialdehyde-2,1-aminomutase [Methanococcus vannielii SB]|uniref:Glutamate-1-semialdehyde 2,1-aminomutase n=1 Tax=Methanococcus vannielii (strain ATCC 35089 / DSM 1224 / JCM 13029 / OCM 148 / SB) TaxID=406327 RepID=GSA_METVS|nr:glutamate-1-semialdehyde 2,1-aminomutase [Methanococcus vannielii]A6URL2.1 RecName: Full=Glutamate-1-semialdehyde 2,1-aminomutase; Short=GSA; AltName: Full=Glutamate-1-semialdehyde aminotransferase; Short=GSA-AT [Methanococcus vannielii SB]ABR55134.1 glutamate-1-semialdehyde-2,1-aminomutase [Methanococcus vannielii SB]